MKKKPGLEKELKKLGEQLTQQSSGLHYDEPSDSEIKTKERIFIEDTAPKNAELHGEWKLADDPVFSGAKSFVRTGVGNNQHFFYNSKNPHEVKNNDDEFFAYAFLDPQNPPKQVMLQFNDGNWEHRAYWGESHSLRSRRHCNESKNGASSRVR